MNIVVLTGALSSDPRPAELPSGTVRWALELTTATEAGLVSVPVAWHGSLPGGTWRAGTRLVVAGSVRRRFFRAAGATQSRTEVLASALVELTGRRSESVALRTVLRSLPGDDVGALCSSAAARGAA